MDQNVKTFGVMAIGFLAVVHSLFGFKLFIMVAVATSVVGALTYVIYNGWETSGPNEWLLLIENGQLVKSGVGLKTFKKPNQMVAKFSNEISKVIKIFVNLKDRI
jgi:hypothetical protein